MLAREPISWFPPWAAPLPLVNRPLRGERAGSEWSCERPSDHDWPRIAEGLRAANAALRAMPIAEIIRCIDEVAERWSLASFPPRLAARAAVVRATGFSPEAVDLSFDAELRNYRAEALWRTLRRELGDPRMLDGFVPDSELRGSVRAFGPRITLVVCTGNVPGLPALPFVRALLAKSCIIAKVASGEPSFARQFAASLHALEPRLSAAMVVTYWERSETQTLKAVLAHTDAVMAYGSDEACSQLRAMVPPGQRFVEHGHKLSVGLLTRAYLAQSGVQETAARVARDASMFNQHACIAPQAYFVEGSPSEQAAFAEAVAAALRSFAKTCPLGDLEPRDAACLQLSRAEQAFRAAAGQERALWRDDDLQWTVTLEPALGAPRGQGHRYLRLIGVDDPEAAVEMLRPWGSHLQNVALGANSAEALTLANTLAELGATRLCDPGRMADPSMMWRHDGRTCIAELLRFCDVEHAPALSRTLSQTAEKEPA